MKSYEIYFITCLPDFFSILVFNQNHFSLTHLDLVSFGNFSTVDQSFPAEVVQWVETQTKYGHEENIPTI